MPCETPGTHTRSGSPVRLLSGNEAALQTIASFVTGTATPGTVSVAPSSRQRLPAGSVATLATTAAT
jgi:hypothetical protein